MQAARRLHGLARVRRARACDALLAHRGRGRRGHAARQAGRARPRRCTPPAVKVRARAGRRAGDAADVGAQAADFSTSCARSQPDVGVVVAYGKILPPEVLTAPRARLPQRARLAAAEVSRRRADPVGGHPRRARDRRDASCRSTRAWTPAPMLLERALADRRRDTAGQLHARLAPLGAERSSRGWRGSRRARSRREPQDDARGDDGADADQGRRARRLRAPARARCATWCAAAIRGRARTPLLGGEVAQAVPRQIGRRRAARPGVVLGRRSATGCSSRAATTRSRSASCSCRAASACRPRRSLAGPRRCPSATRLGRMNRARRWRGACSSASSEGAYATLALAGELDARAASSPRRPRARHRAGLRRARQRQRRLDRALAALRAARARQLDARVLRRAARRRLPDPVPARAGARRRRRRGRGGQARRRPRSSPASPTRCCASWPRDGEPPLPARSGRARSRSRTRRRAGWSTTLRRALGADEASALPRPRSTRRRRCGCAPTRCARRATRRSRAVAAERPDATLSPSATVPEALPRRRRRRRRGAPAFAAGPVHRAGRRRASGGAAGRARAPASASSTPAPASAASRPTWPSSPATGARSTPPICRERKLDSAPTRRAGSA